MADRSFPVVYARGVEQTARFYERLGFRRHSQLPAEGEPGYVGLRRGEGGSELAVVSDQWPHAQFQLDVSRGPRFEMYVYVADVDRTAEELRRFGVAILRESADMPWGERVAYVADPDGNPVALAAERAAP